MKKKISAVLAVALCMLISCFAFAACFKDYGLVFDGAEVVGYEKSLRKVVIPEKNDGVTITAIADHVFEGQHNLRHIAMPDTITSIGAYAFYRCINLQIELLPRSLTSIGEYAFTDVGRIYYLLIPDGVTGIGECAFSGTEARDIVIPSSVTAIGRHAFSVLGDVPVNIYCYAAEKPEGWDDEWLENAEHATITWGYDGK